MQAERIASPEETTLRRPFALRELFCLTTLAAICLALILQLGWTDHERWLLGLTLGGTLLGITIARTCRQRGWLAGILAGTLGGLIAVAIIGQDWLAELDERLTEGGWTADELAEFQNDYLAAAATTIGLAVLLALVGVVCFLLLAWATDGSQRGMVQAARRHPYRSAAVATVAVGLVLAAVNIDFLLAPQAWSPLHFIPQTPLERPMVSNHGIAPLRTGSLSRRGDWLIVLSYTAGFIGPPLGETELYCLDPQPRLVSLTAARPERAACLTFDCDRDRLAYLEWNGEHFYDRPTNLQRIHIVDLTTLQDAELDEAPRNDNFFEGMRWHPGGNLVLDYDKNGHTLLAECEGIWTREESDQKFKFKPTSGQSLEFNDSGMSIVDLDASRVIEVFSNEWVAEMMGSKQGKASQWFELSPNGRFIRAGLKIYDRESQTVRDWGIKDTWFGGPVFYGFVGNMAVSYNHQATVLRWPKALFLHDVPFGSRLLDWLWREPIRIIDPATGLEVARTRPQESPPDSTTFSHDGSRMAVFNDEGVYVYDVPAEFR